VTFAVRIRTEDSSRVLSRLTVTVDFWPSVTVEPVIVNE
jgi:hypothetical protein